MLVFEQVQISLEIRLNTQIADSQAKNREFVEFCQYGLFEGQQTGQVLQFGVQSFSVPFTRIRFLIFFRWMFIALNRIKTTIKFRVFCHQKL